MGREVEWKFSATNAQQARILNTFPGGWIPFAMETTYYDTPTGELSAKRFTLRRRMENGTGICTVKTPAPGGSRGEWETESKNIREAIPVLCKLGGPEELLLYKDHLTEVCGAKFTRQAKQLTIEGCTVEIAVDAGILTGGGREMPLCEVEVELKTGNEQAAWAFAQALAVQIELQEEPRSKFRRALSLAKGE